MQSVTVLLSAAGSPTIPGLLKCFRNNGEREIRIVGVDMVDDPTIKFMVDVFYPVPVVDDESYVDVILEICRKEHVDVYFPNISAELFAVAERIDEFRVIGTRVSIADINAVLVVNNKLRTYEVLKENGFKIPRYYPVRSIRDFEKGCIMLGYPENAVCLKLVSSSGSRGVRIIDATRDRYKIFAHEKPNSFFTSYEDMLSILRVAEKLDEMMLVEYMPGNEYTVDLLAEAGEVLYIAGRENIVSMMSIAQKSIVSKIDSAYEICKQVVKIFNYSGNIGFDFMKDVDGMPVLMDINPRITATVSVIAAAGINLPYLRLKQLLGESLPKCTLDYGTSLVRRYGEYVTNSSGQLIDF
uniref:ATP-grasp domain-containing protein n=1 Tax=Agathobacter sp. TaxID=2021311 RepID=UPI00405622CE